MESIISVASNHGIRGIVIRLPFQATAYRPFSRLRAPITPGEVRRIERWLASARVFLAIAALVAIWMDPSDFGYSPWAYWILGLYIVHGVVVMLLLRFRQESTSSFRLRLETAARFFSSLFSFWVPLRTAGVCAKRSARQWPQCLCCGWRVLRSGMA
jgi:hypothetical protein